MNNNPLLLEGDGLDLNRLAFEKIKDYKKLGFREATKILGVNFHLSRKQTFQLLKRWENNGWVKIYPHHHIEVLKVK